MSVSLSSLELYLPMYSIAALLVARNGIVFSLVIHMSVE